jgi:hypothetical protein
MSGRGRGRSGRGRPQPRSTYNHPSNKETKEVKKTLTDWYYHLGSAKHASGYQATTDFLINHIKQDYEYGIDIATAIADTKPVTTEDWKPTLQKSKSQDLETKELENEQYKMEFQADFDIYRKRELIYKNNVVKAYALLWARCAKGMQNKIESRSDFETKIKNNPFVLLEVIREHSMHYQEKKYNMCVLFDSVKSLVNTKQREGESLQDYTKRFRVMTEVFLSLMGAPIIPVKMLETIEGYTKVPTDEMEHEKNKILQDQVFEQLLAYIYLESADQSKYGSILSGLDTQNSLGNNQYPKTVSEANSVLSNHRFDTNKGTTKTTNKHSGEQTKREPEQEKLNLSFAQLEGKCYCCGKAGHKSPQCRFKDKPKSEWAINKVQQVHAQTGKDDKKTKLQQPPPTPEKQQDQTSQTGWAGVHYQFLQEENMQDWILLDNESTVTIFCNPDMVNNIRPSENETLDLVTNAGILRTNQKATVPGWGEVWFNNQAITNIFSYAEMAQRHRITYDSDTEDAFIVHLPDKQVKFTKTNQGLYIFKPKIIKTKKNSVQLIQTIDENKAFFTNRQFARAKKARDLYHALGTPSVQDFKAMLRMNIIANNPVTIEDIEIAEQIFGSDIGSLKGKTTRKKPIPVVNDYIAIPEELYAKQQDIILCIDGIKVNGMLFLTTVSKNLFYRTAQYVESKSISRFKEALKEIIMIYNKAGFKIKEIRSDNEFRPLQESLSNDFGIGMNFANPQEHVPEAERNNRVIKERVRATYHRLPYKQITKTMTKILVMDSAKKLNFFPAKNGISEYFSPRMLLHQRNLDYTKNCKFTFGTYVQAHDEPSPTNDLSARTLDCIYLRYRESHQGGHELLHLPTNKIIIRRNITPLPITREIVDQVSAIANSEGMPSGLKIVSKTDAILYDSAWIAGVDINNDDNDDDDNDDDEINNDNAIQDDEMHPDDIAGLAPTGRQQDNLQQQVNDEEIGEAHQDQVEDQAVDDDEIEIVFETDEEATEEEDPEEEDEPEPEFDRLIRTRSGRVSRPVHKYVTSHQGQVHLNTQAADSIEYSIETAKVIALTIDAMNHQFAQTYSLTKGIKTFGEKGRQAAHEEMKQLHERIVFKPIKVEELTAVERRRAMESLIFITEKKDGRIKARTCANGSTQREYTERNEAASPTALTESHLITAVIDAKQGRDIMTADIPNAFVQTEIETKANGDRTIMKIRGQLVDMLVDIAPQEYQDFVRFEGAHKVLYVEMIKALYGMLQSSLLYYKKFRKDLEEIGFEINPYDPCVANRVVNNKQHTVTWHVDDLKSSHVDPKVNDKFLSWLKTKYASDNIGEIKATRGHKHEYLAMTLDFTIPGVLQVDMTQYVNKMIEEFPEKLTGNTKCPWSENLFRVDETSPKLSQEKAKILHTFVMKGMFLCKRARQDVLPGIVFLATRVKDPNHQDWIKLIKILNYLKATKDDIVKMSADDSQTIKWYVDSSFAVHKDMRGHTGAIMTLGTGAIISDSTKQKVNARSSTESEMIAADDMISKILWTKRFIEAQGHQVSANIVYQDNSSAMKLEMNGKASSGKRTRHFDIKFFYFTDLIKRKEMEVRYCPTDEMVADYMTKPLVGSKFITFRKAIMDNG